MFFDQEAVQFSYPPSLETGGRFTVDEIQELLSHIQSGDHYSMISPSSNSQGSIRAVYLTEDRKRKRMISNRESARRSRWRKKRHLEGLTDEVNRLGNENQELKNQLGMILHQVLVVSGENDRLRSEAISLLLRLSDLYQILSTPRRH
ncbi:Basic-leucine zipper transcription factor [Quillaja saponaria]|uniref:Basic-leucine zipper transcription factor n=1 Tax=Quillaja saponaria TaxID=32244 RepID=A0AAD7LYF5_QUISA|nr:Basic-leucine zipper transcription factor [Quillaja saponaria]